MKILILILSSNNYPSNINKYFQKISWLKNYRNEYFFYQSSNSNFIKKKILYLDCSADYKDINLKTIKAFEFSLKEFDFDFLLRTNTSSYIDIENLYNFLSLKKDGSIFAGHIGRSVDYPNFDFISGSAFILSRDLVNQLIVNKNSLDYSLPDDLMISKFFKQINIQFTNVERNELGNYPLVSNINFNLIHTRCRLDVHNLPRFLEGILFLRLKRLYRLKRSHKNSFKLIDLIAFGMFYFLKINIKNLKKIISFFKKRIKILKAN